MSEQSVVLFRFHFCLILFLMNCCLFANDASYFISGNTVKTYNPAKQTISHVKIKSTSIFNSPNAGTAHTFRLMDAAFISANLPGNSRFPSFLLLQESTSSHQNYEGGFLGLVSEEHELITLSDNAYFGGAFDVSGKRIAFSEADKVVIVGIDGARIATIENATIPVWCDATRLAFTSLQSIEKRADPLHISHIGILDLTTMQRTTLTEGQYSEGPVACIPGTDQVLFISSRDTGRMDKLWRIGIRDRSIVPIETDLLYPMLTPEAGHSEWLVNRKCLVYDSYSDEGQIVWSICFDDTFRIISSNKIGDGRLGIPSVISNSVIVIGRNEAPSSVSLP